MNKQLIFFTLYYPGHIYDGAANLLYNKAYLTGLKLLNRMVWLSVEAVGQWAAIEWYDLFLFLLRA